MEAPLDEQHPDPPHDAAETLRRYRRQMQLRGFGADGQARIGRARVLVAGCGALGTVVCEQLARAGVGMLVVVDRDVVEPTNLQRQSLFTERDAALRVPKAEAAKSRLAAVNRSVVVRAFVDDLDARNMRRHAAECDLLVDCLDNFETRYLLNDCAVESGRPLVYGGAVGMRGMAAALLPFGPRSDAARLVAWDDSRATPCLCCLAPEPPQPGEVETCESAGVLAAAAGIAASIEAALVLRLLAEGPAAVPARLVRFDLATLAFHEASLAGARDPDCPCCVGRSFRFLDRGVVERAPRVLCGRGAVEVPLGEPLDIPARARVASRLRASGALSSERFGDTEVLRLDLAPSVAGTASDGSQPSALVLLAGASDTRAIVEGCTDPEQARGIVARLLGP